MLYVRNSVPLLKQLKVSKAHSFISNVKLAIICSQLATGQYGFLSYELEDGKKLFFHMSEVKDHQHLNPGDEVEFVILQNPRNGKSSACSVVKLGFV